MKVGRIIRQMVFSVFDTKNYDLLLGLEFFLKIEIIIDAENGVIQICNGPRMEMQVSQP
jgi:hypothetical protein